MPRKLALVIGNSEYQDPTLAKLKAPDADVRALTALLEDPEIGQFDEVAALVNEPEAKTRRAIASFFVKARPDDVLLLYFSGHGVLDDKGRLYLAANDTQRDLPQATAISAAFVTDAMDSSRSRQQLLILDCCHSGAFARGARGGAEGKAITQATFEGMGAGRAVLTATDATQYAWEGETVIGDAENSVFTHFVIEGLRTGAADTDDDGEITLEELYTYLYGEVVRQTPKQTPRKWSYNQQGEFVIARNPNPGLARPVPLPDDLQASLADLRPWVREGSLRELERLLFGTAPGVAVAAAAAVLKLKEDDSRRVAEAAAETLVRYEAHRAAQEAARAAARQQALADRAAREAREQAEAERLAAEWAAQARERARVEAEAERAAAAQAARAKAERERAEAERLAAERQAAALARAEADRLAQAKAALERAEAERAAKAEADRLAQAKAEADRIAEEKAEQAAAAKAALERAEAERAAKAEADRLAQAKAEADRMAAERAEQARVRAEAERAAAETAAQAKAEADQAAAVRARLEQDAAELLARQAAAEKATRDAAARERAEADRMAAEKVLRDKAEADRLTAEKEAQAKAEADRLAKLEADRMAAEKAAAAKAEADRLAKLEADRMAAAKAEADRLAKLEADRMAAENAAAAKAEADRLAKLEADRMAAAKAEADRRAAEKVLQDKAEAERVAAERERVRANLLAADRAAKERAAARVAAEQLAREAAVRERAAADKAALERAAQGPAGTRGPAHAPRPGQAVPAAAAAAGAVEQPLAALGQPLAMWLAAGMMAVGWAIGRGLAQVILSEHIQQAYAAWFFNFVLGGALGGLLTGLALRRLEPGLGWGLVGRVAAGWAAGWGLGFAVAFAQLKLGSDFGLSISFLATNVVSAPLAGGVGGYVLGSAWRAAQPRLRAEQVWGLAAGWAASWLVGALVMRAVEAENTLATAWTMGGLAAGLLGAGLMLWTARGLRAGAPIPQPRAAMNQPALPRLNPLAVLPLLGLLAVGWGLALAVGRGFSVAGWTLLTADVFEDTFDLAGYVVAGVGCGLVTGLALRLAAPAAGWKQVVLGAAIWGLALTVGWVAGLGLAEVGYDMGLYGGMGGQWLLGLGTAGALGGWLQAAVWRRSFAALSDRQAGRAAAGWVLGLAVGALLVSAISNGQPGAIIAWLLGGVLAGLIGGGTMLGQFLGRGK